MNRKSPKKTGNKSKAIKTRAFITFRMENFDIAVQFVIELFFQQNASLKGNFVFIGPTPAPSQFG